VSRRAASVNPWLIAAAVMSATFMEVLDTTVVNVALPHIAGNLSASTSDATWVLTSYLVANAIVLPATAWFGSFFGRKRFLTVCIVIFTAASGLCGIATSLPMLIGARILQGAGGGALQPISQAVLLESFPPERRGIAMAVYTLGIVVAPVLGPTIGGWMTDSYSWRWVFYINVPIGILAIVLTHVFIEDPPYIRNAARGRIDYVGFALLTIWIASLQIVLDKGQEADWLASTFICWLMVSAGVGLVAFVIWELRSDEPLVALRLLGNRNFMVGTAVVTAFGAVSYGVTALLPLFLQTLLGYPALQAGLVTSPRGLGSIAAMLAAGRLMGIIDGRVLIAAGFIAVGYSSALLGGLNVAVAPSNVIWPAVINGFGTALVFAPLATLTVATLRDEQLGSATGIFNLMRNLGGSIGIATVTTLLDRRSQTHAALMVGHLGPSHPAYRTTLHALAGGVASKVGDVAGAGKAYALLYAELVHQARLWAFVDDFRLMAALSFLCVVSAVVLRRATSARAVAVH